MSEVSFFHPYYIVQSSMWGNLEAGEQKGYILVSVLVFIVILLLLILLLAGMIFRDIRSVDVRRELVERRALLRAGLAYGMALIAEDPPPADQLPFEDEVEFVGGDFTYTISCEKARFNLNSDCGQDFRLLEKMLVYLPGIGVALSERIADYRREYGLFLALQVLPERISRLGRARYSEIEELLTVYSPLREEIAPINVNTASPAVLALLSPLGIHDEELLYRREAGYFQDEDDLIAYAKERGLEAALPWLTVKSSTYRLEVSPRKRKDTALVAVIKMVEDQLEIAALYEKNLQE